MKTFFCFLLGLSISSFQNVHGQVMNKELQVNAVLTIHDGQLEKFKEMARLCIASTKEKDTGTLQYDWFLDEVSHRCIVRERYPSSEAIMSHMANLGDLLGQLLATATIKIEVFGNPSEELLQATGDMDIKVYPFFGGL